MERVEAERILDGDREQALAVLLQVGELIEANRRLERRVAELAADNKVLRERVETLEERLGRSSRNSSLPPSSDPPALAKRSPKGRGGRGRGGQPGHPGATRMLALPECVDEFVDHWPERCVGCGEPFSERGEPAAEPRRHQVAELPPLAVTLTEHRLHARRCRCGATTRAQLPAGVSGSAFGPRLQAAVATLCTRQRLSRRQIAELLGELFGCPASIGTVDAIIARVGEALEAPYAELRAALPGEAVVHADETGWALAGRRRWLWGGFTPKLAVLAITPGRGQKAAKELLGDEPAGIICSDRWSGYNHLPRERRQVCWAHLARDFQAVSERPLPADRRLGRALLRVADAVFAAYQDYRSHQDQARLARTLEPVQKRLRALLEPASRGRRQKTAAFAADLLSRWPSLWCFVEQPELVSPTNNHAERGLRPAVIKRKLCFGNSSEQGLRATERLLSADGSCRLQQRSLFAYLTETLTAVNLGQPAPTLLPA